MANPVDPLEEWRQSVREQAFAEVHALQAELRNLQANLQFRMNNLTKKVKTPTFFSGTGRKADPTPRNWISSLEVYFRAAEIVIPLEQIKFAGTCLEDFAIEWYNKFYWPGVTPVTLWDHFVDAFTLRFQSVNPEVTARVRLNSLRQNKNSVTHYTNQFSEIIGRVGAMEEKDRTDHYLNGLRKDIGDPLRLNMVGRVYSLSTAMSLAFEIESAIYRNSSQPKGTWKLNQWRRNFHQTAASNDGPVPMEIGSLRLNDGDDEKAHHDGDHDEDEKTPVSHSLAAMQQPPSQRSRAPLPKLNEAERARLRATGSCFRCRQQGHIQRDCPLNYPKV
jgi:Ty3 transposon capsid-like protein/zinc knuckle protein